MGSYINFKNNGAPSQSEGNCSKPAANFALARQSSVYSLTFEELQNTLDGVGKDFGSMNMDELLKSIWTAEGTQPMVSSTDGREGIALPSGNLRSQGSLTLPRTLSQKTVDEVWKDLIKESDNIRDGSAGANLPEREATLSEMTLEEFLFRAGAVGEITHSAGREYNCGEYGNISQLNKSNTGLPFEFQQPAVSYESQRNNSAGSHGVPNLYSNVAVNSQRTILQQQLPQQQQQQQKGQQLQHQQQQQKGQQLQHQQQQPLLPKQVTLAFASPMNAGNNVTSHGMRSPNVGKGDPSMNKSFTPSSVAQSGATRMSDLAPRVTIPNGSPKNQLMSNMITSSHVDTSSLSPSPYSYNEGTHGRKNGSTFEKVVERRRKRMIKNRESAARSRARKQAYTLELEAEVAKLKEVNENMQKKQVEIMEMQKSQILEKMNMPWGKRLSLRRTLTGPW